MARAIWSGAVSFGLVNVPVKAFAAVRAHTVHFNQLEKGTGARIRYKKVSDKSGKEVEADDIESGYELSSGKYVVFDPDELDKLRPKTTRTIDITDFVDLDEVDPIYYDHTYWLAPDGDAAERAYRLLEAAMEAEEKVGIGSVVMRNKQYLAAVRPLDGALALSTMRFADEVVPQSDIDAMPSGKAKPEAKEMKLASQIIDSLATEWDPKRYHDTYTEQLKEIIDAKAKGKDIVAEEEAPAEAKVIDLMAALEASLKAARKGGGPKLTKEMAKVADQLAAEQADEEEDEDGAAAGNGARSKGGSSKAPAKKATAKKPTTKKRAPAKQAAAKKASPRKASASRTKSA